MTPRNTQNYGWRPDLPDHRDHVYRPMAMPLPSKTDLRPHCSPVEDQGLLGSCTGNAIVGVMELLHRTIMHRTLNLSRLFAYYNIRALEGTINSDAGGEIRDAVKAAAQVGICVERDYPYNIADFTKAPSKAAVANAGKHKIASYCRVTSLNDIKASLAQGFPVIFGFTVYEGFESEAVATTGVLNMPGPTERVVGGHAVVIVGHDDASQRVTVRNSWGATWGDKGYFTMPYAYASDPSLCDDFWTVRK